MTSIVFLRDNLTQPIETLSSEKSKTFSQFFFTFLNSPLIFENGFVIFEEKLQQAIYPLLLSCLKCIKSTQKAIVDAFGG